jgi:hypothetical protein
VKALQKGEASHAIAKPAQPRSRRQASPAWPQRAARTPAAQATLDRNSDSSACCNRSGPPFDVRSRRYALELWNGDVRGSGSGRRCNMLPRVRSRRRPQMEQAAAALQASTARFAKSGTAWREDGSLFGSPASIITQFSGVWAQRSPRWIPDAHRLALTCRRVRRKLWAYGPHLHAF